MLIDRLKLLCIPLAIAMASVGCVVADEAQDIESDSEEPMLTSISASTQSFTGSLSSTGTAWAAHNVTYSSAGTLNVTLDWSAASADFNLFLADLSDSTTLASATGAAKPETINLRVPAGTYRLGVKALSGSASYTLTASFSPDAQVFNASGTASKGKPGPAHTFPANAGDAIRVTVSWNTTANLNAFLTAPSGDAIAGTAGSTAKPEVIETTTTESGSHKVVVRSVSGSASYTLNVSVTPGTSTPPPPPPPPSCVPRFAGDPGCATKMYYGASVEGGSPVTFEGQLGTTLAVHRTYFQSDDAPSKFASEATTDLANRRMPLMSTKVPNDDWAGVGAGAHDAWLLGIIRELAKVPGPVWLTLHHEPNSDGAPADWVKMQQRARQLIDANAKNIALVAILNGYNFSKNTPDAHLYNHPVGTGVHVMGFDAYCQWSPTLGGNWREPNVVFSPGVTVAGWGYPSLVGEYGVREDPANPGKAAKWMNDAWNFAYQNKFVAISYFNSGANSPDGTWALTGERLTAFKNNLLKTLVARP